MPFLDLAGTPAVRFPDPKIKRIRPDGSQPYTAYYAPLVYLQNGTYNYILSNPPACGLAQGIRLSSAPHLAHALSVRPHLLPPPTFRPLSRRQPPLTPSA